MNFDHKNKSLFKAIGLTKEEAEKVYDRWQEILAFVKETKGEFARSEFIEMVSNQMRKGNHLENALLFDIAMDFFAWTSNKYITAHVPSMRPPDDPREIG